MGKVVTSEGLTDFVQTGKPTEVIASTKLKAEKAAPLEVVGANAEKEPEKAAEPAKVEADDTGLEAEDHDLAERAKKRIGKKHYEMKVAQEAAAKAAAEVAEAERFAENLFNERESWRTKAEAAEARAAELEAKNKPAPVVAKKPDPETFMDDKGQFKAFEYAEALAEYSAKKAVEDDRKAQADAQTKAANEAADAEFRKRMEEATKKTPDWMEVVKGSTVVLPDACLQYIAQSEYGTDIAYFLAKNEDVAAKIKAMHPIRAVAALGKLETSFEKPATKTAEKTEAVSSPATSKTVEPKGAPAPITPIATGAGSVNIDPAKMNFQQLRAYERERHRKR